MIRTCIVISLLLLSSLSFAFQDDSDDGNIMFNEFDEINPRVDESHFYLSFNTSLLMYKSANSFQGKYADVKASDDVPYIGPHLGFGFRFPLFGNFSTSTTISAFYYLNREHKIEKASEEIPIIVSEQEENNEMFGGQISQAFTLRFSMSPKYYFEPFVEVGIGYALAKNKYIHEYNDYVESEYYNARVEESIVFQNISLGFNITTLAGIYFYTKVQKNLLTIGEYTAEGTEKTASTNLNQAGTPFKIKQDINDTRDEYAVSLGFGYIF